MGRAVAGLQLVEADDFSAFVLTLPQAGISRFTYVGSTLVHEDETRFRLNFVTDDRDQLEASYRVFERESTANKLTIKRGTGGFYEYRYGESARAYFGQQQ